MPFLLERMIVSSILSTVVIIKLKAMFENFIVDGEERTLISLGDVILLIKMITFYFGQLRRENFNKKNLRTEK